MKRSGFKSLAIALQVILLGACAPQTTPSPTQPPTLVSIDLAGPKMEVGSTFLYADGTVLVAVPGGIFTMGGGGPDNFIHPINVSDFWIYSTKVTNRQYAYCVDLGLCTPPLKADNAAYADLPHANDPMVGVTFDQATAYCNFVHARLPTEAEWEKTARGPDGNIYPWGDGAPTCDLLNYGICVGKTTPVTTYTAGQSYYHAFDMEGNALEWVADRYQADYYPSAPTDDPQGPDKGRDRVVRSSAFNSGGDQTPAFIRFHSSPDTHRDNLSFRCVVDDPTYFAPFCNYPATYGTDGIGGGATGAQPQVDCPNVSIDQEPTCSDANKPLTHVHFLGPWTYHSHPVSCTQMSANLVDYDCTESGDLTICYDCKVTLGSPPQCPSGYDYDESSHDCLPTAAGAGECLPGFTQSDTESGGQCCAFTPPDLCGPGHDPQDPLCQPALSSCPSGTTFDGQECISTQLQNFCKHDSVDLAVCTPGTGGDPLVCPGVTCGQNYILNPNTCQCDCNGC